MATSSPPPTGMQHVKNALEWTVFGVSCLLVLATLAILIMEITKAGKTPPMITVKPGQGYPVNGRLWIPVEVTNTGGLAAVNVEVGAQRPSQGGEDKAAFTVEHLPRGATRMGHVSFPGSNADIEVDIRVLSYQEP